MKIHFITSRVLFGGILLVLLLSIPFAVVSASRSYASLPQTCEIYAVQDYKVSDSQLFKMDAQTGEATTLGPIYPRFDIEGMDIHPETGELYAVGGDKIEDGGPIYRVDKENGDLELLTKTGLGDQVAASFRPSDNRLWLFAKKTGLVSLDLNDPTSYTVEKNLRVNLEGLAWNMDGSLLYASSNKNLYTYDPVSGKLKTACKGALPGGTEALEMDPSGVLIGSYQDGTVSRAYSFNPESCSVIDELYVLPYDDVESLTFEACKELPTPTPQPYPYPYPSPSPYPYPGSHSSNGSTTSASDMPLSSFLSFFWVGSGFLASIWLGSKVSFS